MCTAKSGTSLIAFLQRKAFNVDPEARTANEANLFPVAFDRRRYFHRTSTVFGTEHPPTGFRQRTRRDTTFVAHQRRRDELFGRQLSRRSGIVLLDFNTMSSKGGPCLKDAAGAQAVRPSHRCE